MIPAAFFVGLPRLPLTAQGKIDLFHVKAAFNVAVLRGA